MARRNLSIQTEALSPYIIHVVLPIILGSLIYVAWRSQQMLWFDWIRSIGLTDPVDSIRAAAHPWKQTLPNWFLYSVPDALWVYSTVACFGRVWHRQPPLQRIIWTFAGPFIFIASEFGQMLGIVPGAFDSMDIFQSVLATLIAWSFIPKGELQ